MDEVERRKTALTAVNVDGVGLEVGPLDKPLVLKVDSRVQYVDHLGQADLVQKYRHNEFVDVTRIVDVDIVTSNLRLVDVVDARRLDFIVASHVIEHVPDFAGFVADCMELLRPGGVLSLVVPDKRYTFDVNRRLSTFSDVYAASVERRRAPSIRDVCDHYFEVVRARAEDLWPPFASASQSYEKYHTVEEARHFATLALEDSRFIDCHVWVFEYDSFLRIVQSCIRQRLMDCEIMCSYPAGYPDSEFFCSLVRPL